MKMKISINLAVVFTICLLMSGTKSESAVTVTPVSNGSCLAISPGPFTVMTNIIITEGVASDFAVQMGSTLILTAPAGFEFNAGSGTVTFTAGRDITSASLTVTAATITVTLNIPTNTSIDILRIRNVGVRALLPNTTGNILRTITGGTATIAGDAPGAGVNHGSLSATGTGGAIFSVADGDWSNATTWSAGIIPGCTDDVTINHEVTADINPSINDLTINTGGNLISDMAVTVGGNFNMNGTAIYTHNNTTSAPATIFAGTENFGVDSKIIVDRWSSYAIPLASSVTGDFGEIEINTTGTWNQAGLFAPARVKNTLTITAGFIVLDNGSGMTTALTLQDVLITGTGRMQIQTGTPRDLVLSTGNFTDNSSASAVSSIVYRAVGDLDWTVNGDLNLAHRFSIIEGQTAVDAGTANVYVTGNFVISAGIFDGMKRVTGPFTMTVDGTTSITGNPGNIMFKDYYTGDFQFNSGSMTINSNTNVYFLGSHSTIGAAEINITGDLVLSGGSTRLLIAANTANTNDITLNVSNDIIISESELYTTLSSGDLNINIGRNFTQTGIGSEFYGQRNTANAGITNINVGGSLSVSDGLFVQSRNLGDVYLDVVETVSVQNAVFNGMHNTATGNNGIASLTCADLLISGSSFYLHRGYITDGRSIPVTVTGDMSIEFTNSSQQVILVNRASDNSAVLDLSVGANFIVFGSANGLFCSSVSAGNEIINIGSDLIIMAGRVRFNAYEYLSARGHVVTGTINGSFIMSGGSISLSSHRGNANWDIIGDYEQTGGYAVYKWLNLGTVSVNVMGNYTLNNSTVTMYSRTSTAMAEAVTLVINGNASFDNSTLMFDSCLTSSATHRVVFQGANVTFNDNVVFDHAAHLSNRVYFGNIIYNRAGTITLSRNSATFDIRQTKQIITPGTTVDFASSPFDMMISSHMLSAAATNTTLTVDGTLNMGVRMITARNENNYFATVNIANGGRLRTGHVNGLYSGSATNSCIYPMIAGSLRMNYFLHSNSTVEYNGTDTQIITGTGLGLATTTDHRYGHLDINFQGTPDSEFAYPYDDNIYVRNSLILTNGELNLDDDHITNTGGRILNILNGAAITRTDGYIRSETEDGSGAVRWNITANGSYVIPFGQSSSEYIPFTFQQTAGSSDDVVLATNRVAPDNTPYPPTVTHVRDGSGVDNSANTVDRFWRISVPGNSTANMIFSVTNSERGSIANPRAQLWEPISQGWFPPAGSQSNPTANTTQTNGTTGFNNWWTLSSSSNPLPVELLSFEAKRSGARVALNWVTASEINNSHFTVERSTNGSEFTEVVKVEGAGTTSSMNQYNAFDNSPANGINYYRLKQTDFDGSDTYSEMRNVWFTKEGTVSVYPNPVVSQILTISTSEPNEKILSVNIFDLTGKLLISKSDLKSGNELKTSEVDLGAMLTPGSYMVEINTSQGVHREKVIKQ